MKINLEADIRIHKSKNFIKKRLSCFTAGSFLWFNKDKRVEGRTIIKIIHRIKKE